MVDIVTFGRYIMDCAIAAALQIVEGFGLFYAARVRLG
jgi:hypothetical protein